jgi:hypothetical protein
VVGIKEHGVVHYVQSLVPAGMPVWENDRQAVLPKHPSLPPVV